MTSMQNNLRQIRRQLENQAENNEVSEQQVMRAIKDNAGYSRRTKERYMDLLIEESIIKKNEGSDNYVIDRKLHDEMRKDIDHNAGKKNVTLSINADLIENMERLGVNKSEFMEKKALEEFSNIKNRIKEIASDLEDPEDAEFIQDLILEDAYMQGRNDEKRKQLYKDHFPRYNEFACEELRKTAVKVAEKLGIEDKPKGL